MKRRRMPAGKWAGYVYTLLLVLVATLLRFALQPLVGSSVPFLTYFVVSLLVAWSFGFRPAVVCVSISTLVGSYFFLGSASQLVPSGLAGRVAVVARVAVVFFVVGTLAVCYLLTSLKAAFERVRSAEQEQRRVNQELAQTNRDLKAFAFAASHDLREPLRTISAYSQILLEAARTGRDSEADMAARFIFEGTRRMGQLLDDLRIYTSLNLDAPEQGSETVNLNTTVQQTIENLGAIIAETHAVVTYRDLPAVRGRQVELLQLFQNLIENAIKYAGSRSPEILVTARREGPAWCVAVRDNGIGIDAKYGEYVFEVFKRLDGTRPGTGVGLAICRRVVERHGGRIWVESEPGHGSTFYFTLPILEEE
jgi:signal transduction histidine kinase